jgi:hypothetical protein
MPRPTSRSPSASVAHAAVQREAIPIARFLLEQAEAPYRRADRCQTEEDAMEHTMSQSKEPIDVVAMFPQVADISDATLRKAVIATWETLWEMSPWKRIAEVPTSTEIPYPTLPHNQCVLEMAMSVADLFERHHGIKVNRDYLIAAAVLQDASKVVEFAPDAEGKVVATDIGKQYPHAFWAAHLALRNGIPDEIVHVLLTHSPQAPKFPATLEGKILYYVDQIDVIGIHKDRWRKELFITK